MNINGEGLLPDLKYTGQFGLIHWIELTVHLYKVIKYKVVSSI